MSLSDITLDSTVRPQDDFFHYVNNDWLARHPIPESESRWGTFNVLRDEAWHAMRKIYEDLQTNDAPDTTVMQQARDFYHAGIHFDELEQNHLSIVSRYFALMDKITDTASLARAIGELHAVDIVSPWNTFVDSDNEDSTKHIFHFYQSGLTLPNRDYYLEDSEKMLQIRKEYEIYAKRVHGYFPDLGETPEHFWQTLIHFETALAQASRSSADLRDVEKNFNRTSYSDLKKTYSAINWDQYSKALGWNPTDQITVDQPDFLSFINDSFTTLPLTTWRQYLKWRVVCHCLSKISTRYAELSFDFSGRILNGTKEMMPLWKRVVLAAEHSIGDATGQLYAEKHFPESSKQQVLSLVEQVRKAYSERIDALDWMSDDTKQYAQKKLQNMKVLIGYPDSWRDFSSLTITRTSYLGNILEAQRFEVAYWLNRLNEPTSREDWFMTPQTVNAYHDPNRLVICFPAAILQSPFFDPHASTAANMGGIGMVIGHELSHGFDDQGCMFDAEGNVRIWQTQEERDTFAQKAQIIVDQADTFEALPELPLRGKLVLGESIADLGGIEIALHALKTALAHPDIDTLREFFINYAHTECTHVREQKIREFVMTDPHPISEFRVNGILQHVDDFYKAFHIAEGDTLYRPESSRARIW